MNDWTKHWMHKKNELTEERSTQPTDQLPHKPIAES